MLLSLQGIARHVAQMPAGALVDATRFKRGVIVVAALAVTLGSLTLPFLSSFTLVALMQSLTGAAGAVFQPAVAAVTLGVVGPKVLARRIGRNESFNHAGNATAAALAGGAAYMFGPIAVFWLMTAMAVASVIAILTIPDRAIDHDLARGLVHGADNGADQPSGLKAILACRPLVIFGVCVTLFHFANAAMLPLVGQKLALQDKNLGTTLMSACIVAAQVVMVPVALIVGAKADSWGRKPLFLTGFAILPIRGFLYTLSDNPYWLVGVQLLDGIGAGIFGALFPLVVADLTRGTGRFNISQGAVGTMQGIWCRA